jgi:hypothetical protein
MTRAEFELTIVVLRISEALPNGKGDNIKILYKLRRLKGIF